MKKHLRTLLVGVSALIALGTLSACSGGKTTEATNTSEAVTTPPATAKPFCHAVICRPAAKKAFAPDERREAQ